MKKFIFVFGGIRSGKSSGRTCSKRQLGCGFAAMQGQTARRAGQIQQGGRLMGTDLPDTKEPVALDKPAELEMVASKVLPALLLGENIAGGKTKCFAYH